MILGSHGSSAGHFDHLTCSHNGPVTDILDRPLPSGSTPSCKGQTHVQPLNSVIIEMNMEHGGSTLGDRRQGLRGGQGRLLQEVLSYMLEAD